MRLTKPMLGARLNWAHPLNKGLAGFWLMNEGGGDKLQDLSMNKNVGTLVDMANPPTAASGWNPGRKGVGLNFDGVNDYVDAGNSSSLTPLSEVSISVWLKDVGVTGTQKNIINNQYSSVTFKGILMYVSTANKMNFRIGNGTITSVGITNNNVTSNWEHYVGTYNGTTIKIYRNGVIQTTTGSLTGNIEYSGTTFIIGSTGSNTANGSIDEVRIWSRALSAQEIMQLYIDPYCMFLNN